jgi:hypothetical protein
VVEAEAEAPDETPADEAPADEEGRGVATASPVFPSMRQRISQGGAPQKLDDEHDALPIDVNVWQLEVAGVEKGAAAAGRRKISDQGRAGATDRPDERVMEFPTV